RQLVRYALNEPQRVGLDRSYLPILVRCHSLAKAQGGSLEERLWGAIVENRALLMASPPPIGWFAEWPRRVNMPWVLLFDGFDEVPTDRQSELGAWIRRVVAEDYAIILTTRSAEALRITSGSRLGSYRLVPLRRDQQDTLARKWLGTDAAAFLKDI